MTIKEGYNSKPLQIKIRKNSSSKRVAEVWLVQEGLPDEGNAARYQETLSYATLDELLDLQDELKVVIKELTK